jgi:hypothetical protein
MSARGQALPFAPGFTDLEFWSEVAGIPYVPRVDRHNGSSVPGTAVSTCSEVRAQKAYSITLSPRAMIAGEMVRSIALAVLRLTSKSNLVGSSTGSSFGLVPLRILSM